MEKWKKDVINNIYQKFEERGITEEKTDLSISIVDNYLSYEGESINELALIVEECRIAGFEDWDPERFAIGSTTDTDLTNIEIADMMNNNLIKLFYSIAKQELLKSKKCY